MPSISLSLVYWRGLDFFFGGGGVGVGGGEGSKC